MKKGSPQQTCPLHFPTHVSMPRADVSLRLQWLQGVNSCVSSRTHVRALCGRRVRGTHPPLLGVEAPGSLPALLRSVGSSALVPTRGC